MAEKDWQKWCLFGLLTTDHALTEVVEKHILEMSPEISVRFLLSLYIVETAKYRTDHHFFSAPTSLLPEQFEAPLHSSMPDHRPVLPAPEQYKSARKSARDN